MNESPVKYRRLGPRTRYSQGPIAVAAMTSSLWLGPDHLLSVSRAWMAEEYKRFYFRDIQTITLQQTRRAAIWSWIFVALAAVGGGGIGFYARRSEDPAMQKNLLITAGIFVGIWLVPLLINLFRGPTCICRLGTAVQTEVLPSLGRIRKARQVLAILQPLIEQTQGGPLPLAEIADHLSDPVTFLPRQPSRTRRLPAVSRELAVRPGNGAIHTALFGALVIDALVGLYQHSPQAWSLPTIVQSLLLLAIGGLSFTAIIKQRQNTVSEGLRRLTVSTFFGVLAILLGVFIYGFCAKMMYALTHPGKLPGKIDFYALPGFRPLSLVTDILELGTGVAGLLMTMAYRQERKARARPAASADQPTNTP